MKTWFLWTSPVIVIAICSLFYLQELTMYDSDDYLNSKRSAGNSTIKRVFFFTHPVVAYRVKIHQMFGDDIIAFKVDFLGTDDISQKNPFKDGTIEKSIGLFTFADKVLDNSFTAST